MERKSCHILGRWVRKFLKKGGNMKKKFFVIGTVLAMLVIMVFPCYGQINCCYQKNNGQLR